MDAKPISAELAAKALAALEVQFKDAIEEGYGPKLFAPGEGPAEGHPVIVWEEGPYQWPYVAFIGGHDEEMYFLAKNAGATDEQARATAERKDAKLPDGVFAEAINHYSLGLYPND